MTVKEDLLTAFIGGCEAAEAGLAFLSNPYPRMTKSWSKWRVGYLVTMEKLEWHKFLRSENC